MMGNISWFYVNPIAKEIPDDVLLITENKREELLKLFEKSIWTEDVPQTEEKLQSIKDIPTIDILEPRWIMDRLKDAVFIYVNGRWINTIILCGIIAEYATYLLIDEHYQKEGLTFILQNSKDIGNQAQRLLLLKRLKTLNKEEFVSLDSIRKVRNDYVHLKKLDDEDVDIAKKNEIKAVMRNDAREVLQTLIDFLNKRKHK